MLGKWYLGNDGKHLGWGPVLRPGFRLIVTAGPKQTATSETGILLRRPNGPILRRH